MFHGRLHERLQHMGKLTRKHEHLREVIGMVLGPLKAADANAIKEVNLAFENVKEVDGLDITQKGSEVWEAAMKRIDESIEGVETRILASLREQKLADMVIVFKDTVDVLVVNEKKQSDQHTQSNRSSVQSSDPPLN